LEIGLIQPEPLALKSMPVWLQAHRNLAEQLKARHIVSTNSGPDILFTEPELGIQEIRRICELLPASDSH
jgi:hypothetical protein